MKISKKQKSLKRRYSYNLKIYQNLISETNSVNNYKPVKRVTEKSIQRLKNINNKIRKENKRKSKTTKQILKSDIDFNPKYNKIKTPKSSNNSITPTFDKVDLSQKINNVTYNFNYNSRITESSINIDSNQYLDDYIDYNIIDLINNKLIEVVDSSFGEGDSTLNAMQQFNDIVNNMNSEELEDYMKYLQDYTEEISECTQTMIRYNEGSYIYNKAMMEFLNIIYQGNIPY